MKTSVEDIKRLMQALKGTGIEGSRDLDLAIHNIDAKLPWMWVVGGKTATCHEKGFNSGFNPVIEVPFYTTSRDGVHSLIRPGTPYHVDATLPEAGIDFCIELGPKAVKGTHASEPMAACIAWLETKLLPN